MTLCHTSAIHTISNQKSYEKTNIDTSKKGV